MDIILFFYVSFASFALISYGGRMSHIDDTFMIFTGALMSLAGYAGFFICGSLVAKILFPQ